MNELKGYMYVLQRHSSLKPKMLLLFSINALYHVLIQQNLTFELSFFTCLLTTVFRQQNKTSIFSVLLRTDVDQRKKVPTGYV